MYQSEVHMEIDNSKEEAHLENEFDEKNECIVNEEQRR
jgi:hypothetical protein